MPLVSINILTKNRASLLRRALLSVGRQELRDFEVIVVDDGSTDQTQNVLQEFAHRFPLITISHVQSLGIIRSRQEALTRSQGKYITILDDDDEWVDESKLKKQIEWFEKNPQGVLCGGGISVNSKLQSANRWTNVKYRPETDAEIRRSMLLRNNFFTSTVMFLRQGAIQVGGFIKDDIDLAEDYDLWLRLGKLGEMRNFQEVFTAYTAPSYNKEKFRLFLKKQSKLIKGHKNDYFGYWLSNFLLKTRLYLT